ncbi:uncharacterized protein N7511_004842 [Penicillium nucicola]|uniref:uncharacterized protein n=1 Tax=Penicillium nucicola TaxID=1850975 RepID=UPI0025456585|nr:uncharacterized protein N7511_004842 [Penicillium nucicola]KAJ5767226.1 hypothetical protein N7511_004842 [Penicillium nucicola]
MALEARVESLECRLEAALANSTKSSTKGPREDPSSTTFPESVNETENPVDDLTQAFGCFTLGDTGELRFFGASSNFSIIQNPSLKVASSLEARNLGITAAQQSPGYFKPSEELQDHLLSLFWRWQNSWQYIVSRESFVHDLYVEKSGRYCTPLLLTAIMALSSRYSSRIELRMDFTDPNTAGAIFARQAKTMLDCEYEAPTTSTVQATAILGLYWASIDNEGLGFMYIGMASRMAMNLGLHSDCSHYVTKGLIAPKDVEERSIAFWGIYVLDK